ncbi:MAG: alpha-N-arabinofuranosidase [Odoribacteraceae bacterium]|jgi:alpha-N-arabinofuranosidase|nr:alpha-N-arabinofuranosidase [Odoribacteraceae bacterium]
MKRVLFTLAIVAVALVTARAQNKLVIHADQGKTTISKHIYGHFAEHLGHCIYGGFWVGEDSPIPNTRGIRNDVVAALKEISIPNLRWPGGCFADEYHWMDGIGPRADRPRMINTHWGGVVEDNSFGTHEFLDLCEQLGCEPYICGNVGSGSVEEMSKWVEYITFDGESPMARLRRENGREKPWKVTFWGIGNENWGCGGNMTPAYYANLYRRYATYCRNYGENRLFKIAGGANGSDYNWTETLMREAAGQMQGLSLHHYTVPGNWGRKGSATNFNEAEYLTTVEKTLVMNELLDRHSNIMDRFDPQKRVALVPDEWGAWYDVEPGTNPGFLFQQNTLRDAIIAGTNLNIFNNHADRVRMANIAQAINVLQAVLLTRDEKIVRTPTYWVFWLYKAHQDATLLPTVLTANRVNATTAAPPANVPFRREPRGVDAINASASRDAAGKIHVTLVNVDPKNEQTVEIEARGTTVKRVAGHALAGAITEHNTFDAPDRVAAKPFNGARLAKGVVTVKLPACSVVLLEME